MPKKAKELSALAVSRLKEPGRYAVGGVDGLHLRIIGNSKAWTLRVKVGDHRCDIGLGPYPEVGLGDAREAARIHRRKVREGVDPLQERREARAALRIERAKSKTFKDCADAYIEAHKAGWKNAKHAKQWGATLETYAYPKFGSLPVASIDTALVREVLSPIWATKTETASRLRGRIESVLDWAKVNGYRDGENPARWRGHLDKLLPARSKVQKVEHHAALPYAEVGAFAAELRKRDGTSSRALEFAILTAARSGEVRGAKWGEFDLVGKVWTIPGERMKAGKEHRIPLSDAAVALIEAMPRVKGSDYVFAAPRGGALSDMALTAVLKRMERSDLTVHGFRSTFRDWAGETTAYPREVIEHALAHQLKDKAEAAYQRGDLLTKRARLMADWATYCAKVAKPRENVVAIKGAA
ncbi:MAG TPA: integrase arm-type DNA-binding domain-containing protein [Sphingomicrobium sp.]|jgi:integrase|nr:integrase arm-type DNA-binding domain-containing protein [Sphingomicrobium sp.]